MIAIKLSGPLSITAFVALAEMMVQHRWIKYQKKMQISQVQKEYGPRVDMEQKSKVPALGGLVFMAFGLGFLTYSIGKGNAVQSSVWVYALLSGLIGLVDDLLKFFNHSSEGFTSRRKFICQLGVTILWLLGCDRFTTLPLPELGFFAWPVAAFFAIGGQNAVNVTDGLDGLAAGSMGMSLLALGLLGGTTPADLPCWLGLGLCLGFLWHNANPAEVFMGDSGSLFLGGLLGAQLMVSGLHVGYFIPLFFIFGIEMASVSLQLFAIHQFKRRVFLMAPLHHHFQILEWKEMKITMRFWLLHAAGMSLGLVVLAFFERWL